MHARFDCLTKNDIDWLYEKAAKLSQWNKLHNQPHADMTLKLEKYHTESEGTKDEGDDGCIPTN